MLTPRLLALVDHIRPGSRLVDVGSDHAYLPIEMVSRGVCPSAIATDIHSGPVALARDNISRAGLSAKIDVRMGDGLSTVSPDEVDDIVIAGMGGEQIADILQAAPFVQQLSYRLLLQPMSRAERLRAYLYSHGFSIQYEEIVCEGDRFYNIMCAAYTFSPIKHELFSSYVGALPASAPTQYWERVCKNLKNELSGMQCRGVPLAKQETHRLLIQQIEEYYKGESSC